MTLDQKSDRITLMMNLIKSVVGTISHFVIVLIDISCLLQLSATVSNVFMTDTKQYYIGGFIVFVNIFHIKEY